MSINVDTSRLKQAILEAKERLRGPSSIKDALVNAIEEGRSALLIEGPKICLKDRYRHFYEVCLDGERIEVSGSSLPDGFSYLLYSEEEYAERLVVDHLSTLTEGRIGDRIREIAEEYRQRKQGVKTVPLPSSKSVSLEVVMGGESIGMVNYFPENQEYCAYKGNRNEILSGRGSRAWPSLQAAVEAVLKAAE